MKKAGIKSYIATPLSIIIGYTVASLIFLFIFKEASPIPVFIIFAIVLNLLMLLYSILPIKSKFVARWFSMFIVGMFLFVLAGVLGKNNFQLEGFFFYVVSGLFGGAIVHYAMAKIIGPLFYARTWCGWSCWSAMIFDLLPYKKNTKVYPKYQKIRTIHFIMSFVLVAILYLGFKFTITHTTPEALKEGIGTQIELVWFLVGNALYYILGIALAFILKDNRAFCKYLCPITVFLKFSSKFTLLRIKGDKDFCDSCQSCVKTCPMSIDIPRYIHDGTRVKSTECIMCMNCVAACPQATLKSSIGLDFATIDYLKEH